MLFKIKFKRSNELSFELFNILELFNNFEDTLRVLLQILLFELKDGSFLIKLELFNAL